MRIFKDVIGIDIKPPSHADIDSGDRSTEMAATRTNLALTRSALAADRTLMAWIRTALAMISFGFTLGKLGEALASAEVTLLFSVTDVHGVSYYLVILGTGSLMLATVQYRVEVADLFRQGLKRGPSLAFFVAVLLTLLGVFAFSDLVTQL
jgi:putative membrane protein